MTTPDELYRAIKQHELEFPLPFPSTTIHMGTFRPHRLEHDTWDPNDPLSPLKPPRPLNNPKSVVVNAVNVTLEFSSTAPGIEVIANSQSARSDGTSVSIDIGDADVVTFTVESQGQRYSDTLKINRPPIIGVGAFTLPVLPMAIVYDPPWDPSAENKLTYSKTSVTSSITKLTIGRGDESNRAVDGIFHDLSSAVALLGTIQSTLADFKSGIDRLGGTSSQFDINVWQVIQKALKLYSTLMGSTTVHHTSGTQVTQSETLTVKTTETLTVNNTPEGPNKSGPGVGDLIVYLQNVRLMWIAVRGGVRGKKGAYLTLLDYEKPRISSVSTLRDGKSGLGENAEKALLALDPFVAGGPEVKLPSNRFKPLYQIDPFIGGSAEFAFSVSREQANGTATARTRAQIVDEREGLLGFLGYGNTDNETTKTTYTTTHSFDVATTRTKTATLKVAFSSSESPALEVYLDRAFGTFAVRPVSVPSPASAKLPPPPLVKPPTLNPLEEVVRRSYQEAFGRDPAVHELAGWLDSLRVARKSFDELVASHLAWLAGPQGANEVREMIKRSYEEAFGRPPAAHELEGWFVPLHAAPRTYADVVGSHIEWLVSASGQNERPQVVRRAYQAKLRRAPSDAELTKWVQKVIGQKLGYTQVLAQIRP